MRLVQLTGAGMLDLDPFLCARAAVSVRFDAPASRHKCPSCEILKCKVRRNYQCAMSQYQYSNVEYTEMVRILARCNDNVSEACRQYAMQFPNVPTPSRVTMLAATQRLRDYGQFRSALRDSGRPPRHTVREKEDILEFFELNPAASTNDAARRFNVTQYFAWSVIHGEGKYLFHPHRAQELTEADKPARVAFCNWYLNEHGLQCYGPTRLHLAEWGYLIPEMNIYGGTKTRTNRDLIIINTGLV